jgi:phage terminase large subunit GpA-like protein
LGEIAAAMDDPAVEKKSARIGFSTLLSSLIAYHFVEKSAPVLLVLPAEADARNAVVALEDIFDTSPALRGRLPNPSLGRSDRNTILYRKGITGARCHEAASVSAAAMARTDVTPISCKLRGPEAVALALDLRDLRKFFSKRTRFRRGQIADWACRISAA